MSNHDTPGVFVQNQITSSVESINPSIPVFIGYTEKHTDNQGSDIKLKPTKIDSVTDYTLFFGTAPSHFFHVNLQQEKDEQTGKIIDTVVSLAGNQSEIPTSFLYYSMRLFFSNGGGECYILSLGTWPGIIDKDDFVSAIKILENYRKPSLIVFPDICKFSDENYGDIIDAALFNCKKIGKRVLITDVKDAYIGETEKNTHVNNRFRSKIISDAKYLKYGAAYFPYLKTTIPFVTSDDNIKISAHKIKIINQGAIQLSAGAYEGLNLSENLIKEQDAQTYNALKSFIQDQSVTIPPSGAVAGAIVRNDLDRGVWKAPANLSLSYVTSPAIPITNSFQEQLNSDPSSGKSVNAIRELPGKGTLIWGARTLAGNDNEWRYLSVVRFSLMVEESIKNALQQFAHGPNDSNTWIKIKNMVENFLISFFRAGAFTGQTQEDTYFVNVGLGTTMTDNDIRNGDLFIEIGMAMVRPAEFTIIKIHLKMQIPTLTLWQRILFPFRLIPKFIKRLF